MAKNRLSTFAIHFERGNFEMIENFVWILKCEPYRGYFACLWMWRRMKWPVVVEEVHWTNMWSKQNVNEKFSRSTFPVCKNWWSDERKSVPNCAIHRAVDAVSITSPYRYRSDVMMLVVSWLSRLEFPWIPLEFRDPKVSRGHTQKTRAEAKVPNRDARRKPLASSGNFFHSLLPPRSSAMLKFQNWRKEMWKKESSSRRWGESATCLLGCPSSGPRRRLF